MQFFSERRNIGKKICVFEKEDFKTRSEKEAGSQETGSEKARRKEAGCEKDGKT